MLGHVRRFNYERGLNLDLRIGINTGDLTSGIVGKSRYVYDVWGESVNIAHRLKTYCPPGNILVSEYVRDRLSDIYEFEPFEIIVNEPDKESFPAWKLRNKLQPEAEQSKNSQQAKKATTVNGNSAGAELRGDRDFENLAWRRQQHPQMTGQIAVRFNRDERSNDSRTAKQY